MVAVFFTAHNKKIIAWKATPSDSGIHSPSWNFAITKCCQWTRYTCFSPNNDQLSQHWPRINMGSYLAISCHEHYTDVIMGAMASQITSLTIVYSTVYSDAYQRKHQSSASLAFVWGIHRGPVNSPHKWPVTRKMFPFDDIIMRCAGYTINSYTWFTQVPWPLTIYRIHFAD